MAADASTLGVFKDAMVFLAAAGVAVPLLQRAHVNPVLGFMLAGVAIGPFGLGSFAAGVPWLHYITIAEQQQAAALGELGVVFLLFTIGLDISFSRLWALRRLVFGFGLAQIFVSAAVFAAGGVVLGFGVFTSVLAALALALSSTAVALHVLISRHRFATSEGQTAFSILLMQDLMVVPLLIAASALSAAGSGGGSADIAKTLLLGGASVALLLLAGRFLVAPVMRSAARTGSHELFVAVVLLVAMASAVLTGAAGLSTALGAFIAGVMLSESAFKHQIEADIEPFKGLLLGLFFVSTGMQIDPRYVAAEVLWILAGTAAVFAVKAGVILALAPLFRTSVSARFEVAFLLAHTGEFTLIIVAAMNVSGLLGADAAQFLVAVTVLSMALVPVLDEAGRRLGALLEGRRAEHRKLQTDDRDGAVIIAGYGRVGRMIANVLDAEGVPFLALDADPAVVTAARKSGAPVFFGDASRKDVLLRAGANRAPAFVVTLDNAQLAERMVRSVREEWPHAPIFARAKDWVHADHLRALGVSDVIPEAVEGSLQLAAHVLNGLGFPEGAVLERIDAERERAKTSHEPPAA